MMIDYTLENINTEITIEALQSTSLYHSNPNITLYAYQLKCWFEDNQDKHFNLLTTLISPNQLQLLLDSLENYTQIAPIKQISEIWKTHHLTNMQLISNLLQNIHLNA